MKEGVDILAPYVTKTAIYTRDIISNAPTIKYYEQTRCFACTLLHREL